MPTHAASARTQRRILGGVFFVHGLLFASWAAHIPHVKAHLGLSDGELGVVLLATPVGSVLAMAMGAWLLPRVGSRRMVTVCQFGYCVAGPFVGLADTALALACALFVWGAFQGTLDVAMNTQAVGQQRAAGFPVMSGLHARWSLGALAGAGIGAAAVWAGVSLTTQMVILGIPALLFVTLTPQLTLGDAANAAASEAANAGLRLPVRHWPKRVLLLAAIALASMLCEGAAADWSAVYLHTSLGAAVGVAGLGYAFFAAAMVGVRLVGDRLLLRYAATRVLPALAALATVGFAAGLLSASVLVALIGLALLGAGVAAVVPTVFGAAGTLPGVPSAAGIAAVSSAGWAGFVIGPPLIGGLASATSLPLALGIVPVLTGFIALAAPSALRERVPESAPPTGTEFSRRI